MPAKNSRKTLATRERILEAALALYNLHGEPNVSTKAVAAEAGLSPGNLHYHFASKSELTLALLQRYEAGLLPLLATAAEARNVEDAWLFVHMLFEQMGRQRFLYRNLNDLLAGSREIEARLQALIEAKGQSMALLIAGLQHGGTMEGDMHAAGTALNIMVMLLCYWLGFEEVRDPRRALDPDAAAKALRRGAFHVLAVLSPWMEPASRDHLRALSAQYDS
ncbi:MAG: TetR/AcrR family transcriptional regulator [Paucibacter sp.]|nr:TetR/AcrR family transcriptional regulator [Roseateles sp.]